MNKNKLSLVAQFDDNCRLIESIVKEKNSLYSAFIRLLENGEENRLIWLQERNELTELRKDIEKLKHEKQSLQALNKNLRLSVNKEIQTKERIQKEYEQIRHNAKMAIVYLTEIKDYNGTKEKLLSCFNLNQLEPVMEVSSSESLDLDYDITEEMLDTSAVTAAVGGTPSKSKRKSTELRQSASKAYDRDESKRSKFEEITMEVVADQDKSKIESSNRSISRSLFQAETEMKKDNGTVFVEASRMIQIQSTPLLQRKGSQLSNITPTVHITQPIENRMHTFINKKLYSIGKNCGPCGSAIGFCSSCLQCRICNVICHVACKGQVPIPCVPVVTPNSRSGKLNLISDYVAVNTRPKIPALIVHCCKEIEKRGLQEEGIYRVPGSLREVKLLKENIINSKTGMPSLKNIDIHVICSVVKDFLRTLDEQLITLLLWRDFVFAADTIDSQERNELILRSIDQLPIANRDTLAFIMLHLQKVSTSTQCKMPISNLSKVFGPTIVGNSMRNPPSWQYANEQPKQTNVVEMLLNLPSDTWKQFINPSEQTILEKEKKQQDRRRSSMAFKDGSFQISSMPMTPMRNKVNSKPFKPLF